MRLPNPWRNRLEPFHFDDNPLALRLSGRGYARRLWGFLPRRRLPRARVSPVLVVLVLCFCCCYGYGIVLLPIILLSLHSGVFERLWRDEARSGRLVEWRLCMSSEEIVRGALGGKLLGTGWVPAIGSVVVLFLMVLSVLAFYLSGASYHNMWVVFLISGGTAGSLIFLIPVLAADSIYGALEAISISVDLASSPKLTRQWSRRLEHSMREVAMFSGRFLFPLAASALAVLTAFSFVVWAGGFRERIEDTLGLTTYAVCGPAVSILFAAVYSTYGQRLQREAYQRAVRLVDERLVHIIEANPPVSADL